MHHSVPSVEYGSISFTSASLTVHLGALHPHWCAAAAAKGFDLIARVQDRLHVALRCHTCGGVHASRYFVVMTAQPLCPHCIERRWQETAAAAKLEWLGRDLSDRGYGLYKLACGHQVRRQFGFIERVARGEVAARCYKCLRLRENDEAMRFGWTLCGDDPKGNTSYRVYRHHCGHEQRIAAGNMRWGQCDCARCGKTWTSKPSFIYLFDIQHAKTERHYLKMGYSAHPVKRLRHQLGLPKDAAVEILRVIAMPTGHEACVLETAAHTEFGRKYPEAIVPCAEFADLMNVVSEIYWPRFELQLHCLLDRIAACRRSAGEVHNSMIGGLPQACRAVKVPRRALVKPRNEPDTQHSNSSPSSLGRPVARLQPPCNGPEENPKAHLLATITQLFDDLEAGTVVPLTGAPED
jgi:hypothetical protein